MSEKKILIIGCGVAGSALAMALQKCGIHVTIYESQDVTENNGGWVLFIAPNGVNVLKTLGMQDALKKYGYEYKSMMFENRLGGAITHYDVSDHEIKYGSHGMMIKRSSLHMLLKQELESRGIKTEWNKKLDGINTDDLTTVSFKDGSSVECDYVIGCDGIHSQTRKIIMPESSTPQYSGVVLAGGFSQNQPGAPNNKIIFHFGKKSDATYFVTPELEALWGCWIPISKDSLPDIKSLTNKQWKQKVLKQYEHSASHVLSFIQKAENVSQVPLYGMDLLPHWYKGNVCLVGDSAHAILSDTGQGTSLALESSVVLAKCMRDIPDTQKAFAKYQQLRKPRTDKMILQTRVFGKYTATKNQMVRQMINWFRTKPKFLNFLIKYYSGHVEEAYGYRVDWNKKII